MGEEIGEELVSECLASSSLPVVEGLALPEPSLLLGEVLSIRIGLTLPEPSLMLGGVLSICTALSLSLGVRA